MFTPANLPELHDHFTRLWHDPAAPPFVASDKLMQFILEQHGANFALWHTEDLARAPQVTGDEMIGIKHSIDQVNQLRNDLVEKIDTALLALAPTQNPAAPLHSETPGLMIDRLSILALKAFHTAEEAHREGATAEHHQRNQTRLAMLTEQRSDLATCLTALWSEVLAGHRRFKLYRQLKMYNDPTLNPILYASPNPQP